MIVYQGWSGMHYGVFQVNYRTVVPDFEHLIYVGF